MSGEPNQITETAKAVQEVAKTTNKGFEVLQDMSRFVARITSGSLEQAAGMVEDKLRYVRWERQQRLMMRSEEFMREVGIEYPTRPVPFKVAVPLLESASLEEDDSLQDLWAKLLVNAVDADSGIDVNRTLVSILENIGQLEARCLEAMYNHPYDFGNLGIVTMNLPASVPGRKPSDGPLEEPPEAVQVALWNLVRLGCLAPGTAIAGLTVRFVHLTPLGRALMEACHLRREKRPTE